MLQYAALVKRTTQMPKYRLLTAHYTEEDKWLPGDKENEHLDDSPGNKPAFDSTDPINTGNGTVVGDGTKHKWTRPPTQEMVGLDEKSQKLIDEVKAKCDKLDPTDYLPLNYVQEDGRNDMAVLNALKRALVRGSVDA